MTIIQQWKCIGRNKDDSSCSYKTTTRGGLYCKRHEPVLPLISIKQLNRVKTLKKRVESMVRRRKRFNLEIDGSTYLVSHRGAMILIKGKGNTEFHWVSDIFKNQPVN